MQPASGRSDTSGVHMYRGLMLVGALLVLLIGIADWRSSQYVHGYESQLRDEIAADRHHIESYGRAFPKGTVLDENAAVWYRLALARLPMPSVEETRTLDRVVQAGAKGWRSRHGESFTDVCDEAKGRRFTNALACTYCNWELPYRLAAPSAFDSFSQALLLADCVMLQGFEQERENHVNAAAAHYLDALSFACDLGVGDFDMNFAGLIFARNALSALGQVVVSVDSDSQLLADLRDGLDRFEHRLPIEHHGLHMLRLRLAAGLLDEMHGLSPEHPVTTYMLPRAVGGWRVYRGDGILTKLGQAIDEKDSKRRTRLAQDVDALAANSESATIRRGLPDHWLGYLLAADDV